MPSFSIAQLCTGSLGDPVTGENFGAGSSLVGNLLTFTSYRFVQKDCPVDGESAIVNQTNTCFTTWHTLTEDHTPGDVNVYMMIVNADVGPGVFYKQFVPGLCPNTTYEFGAWMMNLVRPNQIDPDITFSIETTSGTVLAYVNTGDIKESSIRSI